MSLGFVMLCHTALGRAAEVARYWAEQGCPVVIHVDRATGDYRYHQLQAALADLDNIRFAPRERCEWGMWGIVEASLTASALMLAEFPEVRHVYLASGSCLPLRPVQDLRDWLDARPETDFIESVTTAEVGWTIGGLNAERFTLRFPFSWRRNRRIFDLYVEVQRRMKLRRRLPAALTPHLGSQWWCLTRRTLESILNHPRRAEFETYFRRVWIPDESYFQSLVRLVSSRIESRSLTLSKFDFQGKPHVFYDDHLQLLRRSDCFVARKIWPQANRLYNTFLRLETSKQAPAEPNPGKIDRLFSKAVERRISGRPGLYMQSRFPNNDWAHARTAAPYSVFDGFDTLYDDFATWLSRVSGTRVHGRLFAPDKVHFAGGAETYNGGLSNSAALRDYNPRSFLTNLLWNTRGERQCFQLSPADRLDILPFIAGDSNAQISIISGAFAIPLFRSGASAGDLRAEIARLQQREAQMIHSLRHPSVKAKLRIWTLAEYIEAPNEALQSVVDEISPRALRRFSEAPVMHSLDGFGRFLQELRNQGMKPELMGDFPLQAERARRALRRAPALPTRE